MSAIVVIHIDSYFAFFHSKDPELVISRLLANFSRFCVPAFVFSSGFFLSWKGTSTFWTSKVKHLLIPYLVIACIGFFTKYPPETFLTEIVPKLILGTVFQPYYYVPLLFGFYLVYALFFRSIQTWSRGTFYFVLIGSLLINFASNHFYPRTLPILGESETISFTNYFFFFVAGFSAKKILTDKDVFIESIKANRFYFPLFLFTIFLYLSAVAYYTIAIRVEISNHFLFYPIACFIALTYIGIRLESAESKNLKRVYSGFAYIGENSLALFLLHPIVIHLMHRIDPYYLGGFYLSWIVTFVVNIILPLLIWKLAFLFDIRGKI
ncbi:MAG: acyltransferase [Leptospiraceae bacterium]|nr:acyltransferase [Leptospiraceae bacterium]